MNHKLNTELSEKFVKTTCLSKIIVESSCHFHALLIKKQSYLLSLLIPFNWKLAMRKWTWIVMRKHETSLSNQVEYIDYLHSKVNNKYTVWYQIMMSAMKLNKAKLVIKCCKVYRMSGRASLMWWHLSRDLNKTSWIIHMREKHS